MAPRYRTLQDTFIEPNLFRRDAVIETFSTPGNHLKPLNEEAEAAMEAWYNQEFDEIDKDGKKTGKKVKPHLKHKLQRSEPAPLAEATLIAEPRSDAPGTLGTDLASAQMRTPSEVLRPAGDGSDRPEPEDRPDVLADGTKVIEDAKPSLKDLK